MGDRKIFVNLPVKDLKKSMSFYEAIGFRTTRSSLTTRGRAWSCRKRFT